MRRIALFPALAIVAGAVAALHLELPPRYLLAPVPLLAAAGVATWCRSAARSTLALLLAGFALTSCALGLDARQRALHPPIRDLLEREFGGFVMGSLDAPARNEPLPVRFALVDDAAVTRDAVSLHASLLAVQFRGTWHTLSGEGARLTVAGELSADHWEKWRAGRELVAPVAFRRPARYLNDGVPDGELALALAGTTLFGSIKSGLLVEVTSPGSVVEEAAARVRAFVRTAVARRVSTLDATAGSIVTAVLIGDRTGLPDDIRERLQAAGTYHVIAISGGNIAIFAGLALLVLTVVSVRGRPAAAVALLVVMAYAHLVSAGPSVWRATLMAVTYLLARSLDHRMPPWHAIACAASLMLIARPLDVRDPGFLLSFGATAALIEGARRANGIVTSIGHHVGSLRNLRFRRETRRRRPLRVVRGTPRRLPLQVVRAIAVSFIASAAVEAVVMPVSAHGFSRVTAAGLVLNLIAVPMMTLVQVGGMAAVIFDPLALVSAPAGYLACASAVTIVESARLVEWAPWLTARVPAPGGATLACYYAGLALALTHRSRGRLVGSVLLALSILAITTGFGAYGRKAPDGTLRFTTFDVGQGDAMLLQVGGAAPVMVDSGGTVFGTGGADLAHRVLTPALWARGVGRLGTLLVTHGDPDHVGGARALLETFAPPQLWTGVPVPSHAPTTELMESARAAGVRRQTVGRGESRAWGDVRIRVLHPPPPDWERQRVRNDDSIVIEVAYGDVALLLTGDIGADVERAIVPMLTHARTRVLKAAHHGSRTSSSRELLQAWRPQIVVISCGRGNTFGHPAPEVLERLASIDARIYRTDREGQITIETDGRALVVKTFAGARRGSTTVTTKGSHEAHEGSNKTGGVP